MKCYGSACITCSVKKIFLPVDRRSHDAGKYDAREMYVRPRVLMIAFTAFAGVKTHLIAALLPRQKSTLHRAAQGLIVCSTGRFDRILPTIGSAERTSNCRVVLIMHTIKIFIWVSPEREAYRPPAVLVDTAPQIG